MGDFQEPTDQILEWYRDDPVAWWGYLSVEYGFPRMSYMGSRESVRRWCAGQESGIVAIVPAHTYDTLVERVKRRNEAVRAAVAWGRSHAQEYDITGLLEALGQWG